MHEIYERENLETPGKTRRFKLADIYVRRIPCHLAGGGELVAIRVLPNNGNLPVEAYTARGHQFVGPDCFFVAPVFRGDPDNLAPNERYIMPAEELKRDWAPAQSALGPDWHQILFYDK